MDYYIKKIESPVGLLTLAGSDKGLRAVLWENDNPKRVPLPVLIEKNDHEVLLETEQQLKEYFAGKRKTFSITLDPEGTDFQKSVWKGLQNIPYGETRSYSELAIELGNLKAVRAVGAANGKNPISIIVPCHRVIGASGSLTGFAGGLANKEILLNLESNGAYERIRKNSENHQMNIF